MKFSSTKVLVGTAALVALATITSFIKLFSFPTGGSITLCSMLFVALIGYFYSWKVGLCGALCYGLLQFVIKPEFYTPLQVIIDYALAFGTMGLSGVLCGVKTDDSRERHHDDMERRGMSLTNLRLWGPGFWRLISSYMIAVVCRFVFATISGYVFWGEYAWEGWNPLLYSAAYNAIYIFSEAFVTVAVLCLPAVRKAIEKVREL